MATEREEAERMPAAAPSPGLPSQPLRPRPLRVPPLLLSGGPDENGAWISPDEENLSLLGDKYAIKMRFSDDAADNCRGGRAVRIHGHGPRKCFRHDHAIRAQGVVAREISLPIHGEHAGCGGRTGEDSPTQCEPPSSFEAGQRARVLVCVGPRHQGCPK